MEFGEFSTPSATEPPGNSAAAQLTTTRDQIDGRLWLHLGQGRQFFAPENLITRLSAVLRAEPEVLPVAINFADADRLTGACAPEDTARRAVDAGRYTLTDQISTGPAIFDTARIDRAGGIAATAAGLRTASLDEALCTRG